MPSKKQKRRQIGKSKNRLENQKTEAAQEEPVTETRKEISKLKKMALVGAGIMFVIVLISLLAPPPTPDDTQYLEGFANCIADSGAKMYGAYWCSHCANQKEGFKSAWNILVERGVYVECDPNGENPQSELCLSEGVTGYPTWKFSNGEVVPGEIDHDRLAALTGC